MTRRWKMIFLLRKWNSDMEGKKSKRGRVGEGRPTKRTPEVVAKIAEAVAIGLTDREAGILAGVRHDTMTEWRKDPEFSEAIERATAQRLLLRLGRIEAGEQGWQGTAWALERLYPARFARPEVMNQIAVVKPGRQGSCRKGDCSTGRGVRPPCFPVYPQKEDRKHGQLLFLAKAILSGGR